jgi:asparagine synthase (glutamine-hydrolysing)
MLLHWEDRNRMAHGVEARVPFLDHRLVKLAIALCGRHKIQGAKTKILLRRALGDLLSRQVLERNEKRGFATPELDGPLRGAMRVAVEATLAPYPDLLDRKATLALADEMLAKRRAFDFSLWRIACVGLWGKRFQLNVQSYDLGRCPSIFYLTWSR